MKKISLMLAMMALMFSACVDEPVVVPDEDALPEITFEGKNVLACRINGKVFKSASSMSILNSSKPTFEILNGNFVFISGADYQKEANNIISLASSYEKGQVEFDLNYYDYPYFTGFSDESTLMGKEYHKIDSEPHYLKLLHLDDKIAVGTFAFTAVSEEGDTVRITNGRFDIARD